MLDPASRKDRILDAWARGDAAKAIAAAEAGVTIAAVCGIVERARALHDPRAKVRVLSRYKGAAIPAPLEKLTPRFKPLHAELGISKKTILATVLGINSANCWRVPVSISCLRSEVPTQGEQHGI